MTTPHIPLSAPDITAPEIEAVAATLRSPHLSLGPRLPEFEATFTALTGVPHAIAVSSGTAALHLAMLALNITAGDEVIVPSFTFIAAANAIRYVGATPIFVDIDPLTLNLSPTAVEAAITPRTRAIIAVHTFGIPANMPALVALAQRHNLFLIEDACEAIGAILNTNPIGAFADIAVFAFYPNKQITTGEGGMIVTRDPDLAARMRSLRNQGRSTSGHWLQHTELGYNYRLSDIACTLGIGQMQRLPEILARRENRDGAAGGSQSLRHRSVARDGRVAMGQSSRRDRHRLPRGRAVAVEFHRRGRAALSVALDAGVAARGAVHPRSIGAGLRGRQALRIHAGLGADES